MRKSMSLAAGVALMLAAAAPALAESGSAHNSGKLVDIGGGREMYMECRGTGSPTVVFVSGGGDRTETWSKTDDPSQQAVLPVIAETNRVCTYDRPGTFLVTGEGLEDFEPSRSDPVPQPRTLQNGVADLHALLSASGERGPYVVVGHSLGGAIARIYASEYPQDVSGLVLIDYTPYDARTLMTDEQWENWQLVLGIPPQEAIDAYPALERFVAQQNLDQFLAAAPLKPMPMIVLSQDEPYDLVPMVEDGTLSLTTDEAKEFGRILLQAFRYSRGYLVSLVPGGRHITDTDSGHYIHQEQPQLVIDSVREVLDAVEAGGGRGGGVVVPVSSATASATASPTATASAMDTTLSDTGGGPMVSAVTLAASLALVISGLAVIRFMLRRNAS